ncbi:MAG TPA: glycerate kinase [Verrucomicrobiota bacterium]|nr:glycerate kinase [Verrucomicrobiota bacterium]HNU51244.1 glycerate kinase [Verrucomicrobiota bacterium]
MKPVRPGPQPSLRILVAPDKFKGTLSAPDAARAIAQGWRQARPHDRLHPFPISDGGDGFGALLARHLGAVRYVVRTVDAAHRPLQAVWWFDPRRRLAIIEAARVIGLAMLPPGRFHPFTLDTAGLAAVLRAAARRNARACLVGIGGSATNDAGFGLAHALGWQFLDAQDTPITQWTDLWRLHRITPPNPPLRLPPIRVAVDVQNPLLGPSGATRVYGPQKGMRPDDTPAAERCLRQLARVIDRQLHPSHPCHTRPGAGAAGGLGFAFAAFTRARLVPGFDLFARLTHLPRHIRNVSLVLTGEGAIDRTTLTMGKGVGQLARLAQTLGRPCIALAGRTSVVLRRTDPFHRVFAITPSLTSAAQAMAEPTRWLHKLARHAAVAWTHAAPH